jgi:3-hydroxybutyryl-CoA dehydrogenase
MGAGIAHAFVLAGSRVVVVERDDELASAAGERVRESLAESVTRGTATRTAEEMDASLSTSSDVAVFTGFDLVIEAVPEDLQLKLDALRRVETVLSPGAALASNTSSISIGELSAALARPADFLGLHFFNPVPASQLVEIVVGPATAPDLAARAATWVEAIGKTPVTVNDAPGFASSRLGVALGLEAIRMLESGVASAADIDLAMTLGYKHPVGPLRLTDIVDSTCASASPSTCTPNSAIVSNRPPCCASWSPRASSAASPARASSPGRHDDRDPAELRPGRVVDTGCIGARHRRP